MIDILQQLRCEFFPYVGCAYYEVIPNWIVVLLFFLPLQGTLLWISWSLVMGEPSPRPRWLSIWAVTGVIHIIFTVWWELK